VRYRERGVQRFRTLGTTAKLPIQEARSAVVDILRAVALDGLPQKPVRCSDDDLSVEQFAPEVMRCFSGRWKASTTARNQWALMRVDSWKDGGARINALTLNAIVAQEFATANLPFLQVSETVRASRLTVWARDLPGFGLRRYPGGKRVYLVQARMGGRSRTVTIGNAKVIPRAQAIDVARRVLLRAQTGDDPAEARLRTRRIPLYDTFPLEF